MSCLCPPSRHPFSKRKRTSRSSSAACHPRKHHSYLNGDKPETHRLVSIPFQALAPRIKCRQGPGWLVDPVSMATTTVGNSSVTERGLRHGDRRLFLHTGRPTVTVFRCHAPHFLQALLRRAPSSSLPSAGLLRSSHIFPSRRESSSCCRSINVDERSRHLVLVRQVFGGRRKEREAERVPSWIEPVLERACNSACTMTSSASIHPSLQPLPIPAHRPDWMPVIERDFHNPRAKYSDNPNDDPLDVLCIRVDPVVHARRYPSAKKLAEELPNRPSVHSLVAKGFYLIDRDVDTQIVARLTKYGEDRSKDRVIASYSTPAYLRRHVPSDVYDRLLNIRSKMAGPEETRDATVGIPWESGPCAKPSKQGSRNYTTTCSYQVQRGVYAPTTAMSYGIKSEERLEDLRDMQEFNYVSSKHIDRSADLQI